MKILASGKRIQKQIEVIEEEFHIHFEKDKLLHANAKLLALLQTIESETAFRLKEQEELLHFYFHKITIEEKDYEKVNLNAKKAQRIIDHLNETLNDKYEVSKDFRNIYKCITEALLQGNIHKDAAEFEQALEYTKSIRDSWKQVMQSAVRGNAN